ncbi:MAG: hypothetical protein Q9218_005874 [Villophora microphyllina]
MNVNPPANPHPLQLQAKLLDGQETKICMTLLNKEHNDWREQYDLVSTQEEAMTQLDSMVDHRRIRRLAAQQHNESNPAVCHALQVYAHSIESLKKKTQAATVGLHDLVVDLLDELRDLLLSPESA